MKVVTKSGIAVITSKKFHEHCQVTENLLKEAATESTETGTMSNVQVENEKVLDNEVFKNL